MWFVFPQIEGLGRSPIARRYAIGSAAEARAYLAHPVLGPRLSECAGALLEVEGSSAEGVLGPVDALKLRSSMTLFAHAAAEEGDAERAALFRRVLERYHGGGADGQTLLLLDM
jgi:uncharacterized protein (DUF1810 family)